MEALKIDKTKLQRFSTYASERGITPQMVYQLEKDKKITVVIIDKVKFVQL